MNLEKVAITKGGKDIGRIIPWKVRQSLKDVIDGSGL